MPRSGTCSTVEPDRDAFTASAARAGVDPGTAYDLRITDAGFAGKWEAALAAFKERPSPHPSPQRGEGAD